MIDKTFPKKLLTHYFVIVTLICLAMGIMGLLFDGERTFGYEAFFSPLILGAVSLLPAMVTYSSKELTFRQMMFRKLLQLLLIEVLLMILVFTNGAEDRAVMIAFAVAVGLVYLGVNGIMWILDNQNAKELNAELAHYQKGEK